jgi:serine/threonine protein kinase
MSYCLNPNCQNPYNPDGIDDCLTCSTILLLDARYRAIDFIGAGGMGRNFLAVDERTPKKKYCVIKQFFPVAQIQNHPTAFQKAVELFKREAAMLDELGDESPQIPRLLAHIEQDGRLYFVQEFIEGENLLKELQQRGAYNESQIFQLLTDLLPILQFIHKRGVIHRDIKLENIMSRPNKPLVLIDFGISKELSTTVMTIGTTVGTLGYAPPEQMTYGESYPASDIYALGATCIHLLTDTFPSLLYDPKLKRWLWRDVLASKGIVISSLLGKILDRMLQEDIRQRYKSVEEVLRDLQFQPTLASSPASLPLSLQRFKFNKFKMPLLVSGGVVLFGLFGYEYLQGINRESKIADCASATLCIEKGADLNKDQKYNAAVEFFSQAIKFDPKNASAFFNRGLALSNIADNKSGAAREKQLNSAIQDYNQAININPNYATAYNSRGSLYLRLGNNEQAIQDYSQAINISPNYALAYKNRGDLYRKLDNHQQAIQDYSQAINFYPNYAAAYKNRGDLYQKLDNHQQAIQDYSQAINFYPNYTNAYLNRGNVYYKLNNFQQALQDYNQSINISPNYELGYHNRGLAYIRLNNNSAAIQDFYKALNIDPNYAPSYLNRGYAYRNSGNNSSAIQDFQKAADLYGQQRKNSERQNALNELNKLAQPQR